jgi:hypothetical protein
MPAMELERLSLDLAVVVNGGDTAMYRRRSLAHPSWVAWIGEHRHFLHPHARLAIGISLVPAEPPEGSPPSSSGRWSSSPASVSLDSGAIGPAVSSSAWSRVCFPRDA